MYASAQIPGGESPHPRDPTLRCAGRIMSTNVLLVASAPAEAKAVRRSLEDSRDGPFKVEWLSRCDEACNRLCSQEGEAIAAVVVDLALPDSQGIEAFGALFRAARHVPILILSHLHDEDVARLAVQSGAQDYLVQERLHGHSLPKALRNMLARSARATALSRERELAQITLNSIGDAVISTDLAGKVTYLNAVAESMTGWSRQEACGRRLQEVLQIVDGESRKPALNPLAMAVLQNRTVALSANCVLIRRDGHESAIEDTAAPIHDQGGQMTGAVIVFHDVSVARALSLRMSYLAQHDFLTELPNRMLLNDRLTQAIASAQRHKTLLALLFVDVDDFKHVNDSRGHAVGDQLLQSIARRLVACVRESDTVSRQGGDEFVVLLSEVARAEDAGLLADKLLAAVSTLHRIEQHDLHVTVSAGISVYPADGASAEALLKSADLALARAKTHGRSHHQFFERDVRVRATG
jgi:diguanylate cyclase (GGDEF)-like protein/PAS domain S-box-containing protein